ncbi:NAD(P)/FAD-dependent oxidoreductase [Persicitalea sp.]|uniref:dihydrolipoyl dehydrogenase family protein n=1 Tax=Persicitalea sp. TaxID=3100273 RepID=UPI003593F1F3
MKNKYDLIVIGAGSGGLGMSLAAHTIGIKVLLIEENASNVGGDCLNFGCIPSKALIHVARQFAYGRQAEVFGAKMEGKADLEKVMEYVHGQQAVIRAHENADYLRKKGLEVVIGRARFIDEETIAVNETDYTARRIVLATGSKPRQLDVKGSGDANLYTNETLFFDLKKLPDSLLVIGGGPIGCEMAQAFRRLGSEVTIVDRGDRLSSKELPEFSEILEKQFEKEGIKILHKAEVVSFSGANEAEVLIEKKSKKKISFDAALVAIGRVVTIEGLGLDKAAIEVEKGKIVIDEYLQTTNSRVYTAGDSTGLYYFSHGAEKHVRQLMRNFFVPFFKKKHTFETLSWVTFTEPEIATFGRSEKDLKKDSVDFEPITQSFEDDDRAITDDYRYGKLVLYVSKKKWFLGKSTILGGSMIAPHAGELVQELFTAQLAKLNTNVLFNKVYAYPVASRINQKATNSIRTGDLTPFLKNVLGFLYRL